MYGFRRMRLAAAMTRLTAAGALAGATARPLMIRAFLTGLQVVVATESPPVVLASLHPAWAEGANAVRATKVSAASAAARPVPRRALTKRNDWTVRGEEIPISFVGLRG